ncbi:hypothetical protein H5410_046697 [Solanum commersonii]|uniref:Uncharacterized protein n=1 Tax=Solanum commersonii TaxID=4109 RepID=A0A9J5XF53_SOLCO|nr:hypothetical protein H5410_046697 [Solanum commersonii]
MNLGVIISQDMDGVPFVAKTDKKVTLASFTNIQRINVEYTKDKSERKKKALVVNVEAMEANATQCTPIVEPTGIPSSSTSTAPAPTTDSCPPLTQAMIYKMGNLAYLAM